MAAVQPDRRRAALSTVGRGSRGLLGLWNVEKTLVIAGTAVARTENRLHVLALNKAENVIIPLSTYKAPAEVWSLDVVDGRNVNVMVAARRGYQSAVEIWHMNGLEDLVSKPTDGLRHPVKDAESAEVRPSACIAVEGQILNVCRNPTSLTTYLSLTQTGASILDASDSLKSKTTMSFTSGQFSTDGSRMNLVGGGWVDSSSAFVASQKALGVLDIRTGDVSNYIDMKKATEASKPESNGLWVPSHPSRVCSVCSDGSYYLYTGGQNGCVRAFDIRMQEILWEAQHARSQWVSMLSMVSGGGLISGGTDGVVRCWAADGEAVATFPQHDDTVTNASCSANAFATVSYDGRIAINEMPVAT